MNHFEIIIYWSNEDQAFIADVPELPGCMAHGDTHELALAEVKQSMALWIEAAQVRVARYHSRAGAGCFLHDHGSDI